MIDFRVIYVTWCNDDMSTRLACRAQLYSDKTGLYYGTVINIQNNVYDTSDYENDT